LLNIHSFQDALRIDPMLSLINYGKFFLNSWLREART
jgi:hypothetical protein